MADVTYADVLEAVLKLTPVEQARLLERLASEVRETLDSQAGIAPEEDDEPPLTLEEIRELLSAGPKTGAEIAE